MVKIIYFQFRNFYFGIIIISLFDYTCVAKRTKTIFVKIKNQYISRYFRGRIFRSHIWGRLNASDYVSVRILVVDNNQLICASCHCKIIDHSS